MQYTAANLLVTPAATPEDPGRILRITPASAGWEHLTFEVRRLGPGGEWGSSSGESELVLVPLSGRYEVDSNCGRWAEVGGRPNVFAGAAHVLYLPRRARFTVRAREGGEFVVASAPTAEDHAPFLVTPAEVTPYVRGGGNVSRQINDLVPPGAPVGRLVVVEVYTPGGNWSSYPPHKHDRHVAGPGGELLEADLEEVYFFKLDRPEGYACQWVYTDASSPLHAAGKPIDALLRVPSDCAVLVPEGYHPVTSMPGYTTYYLNVLAGSAQSLANQDDPRYGWVKQTYGPPDPRLPLY